MIQGRFGNTTGRPYMEGRLTFPRLKVGGNISFLVDTGADRTAITPLDGLRIGLDYTQLVKSFQAFGVGGAATSYREQAVLAFLEPGLRLCIYSLEVMIPNAQAAIATLPSLLGRDIFEHWALLCDKPNDLVKAEVTTVHHDFVLPPTAVALNPYPGVASPPILP